MLLNYMAYADREDEHGSGLDERLGRLPADSLVAAEEHPRHKTFGFRTLNTIAQIIHRGVAEPHHRRIEQRGKSSWPDVLAGVNAGNLPTTAAMRYSTLNFRRLRTLRG